MKKAIVIGAGKTGRGFVGRLLAEADTQIVFIDKNAALVDALNAAGSFAVHFFSGVRESMTVEQFRAYTWETAPAFDTELIFVAVCGQNLSDVGVQLNARLSDGVHYRIITCENATDPAGKLKSAIPNKTVSVSEATVFCTTIEADGLDIRSENYPYLQCNSALLDGYVPEIPSVRPMDNFSNFLTRKLLTYNAAACVIAYLGALRGYTDFGAAANDPEILAQLDQNYAETNRAMCRAFGYDEADQAQFAALSRSKFTDRTIADTVARNAREPHRKLAPNERIIGAAKLLRAHGADPSVLIRTAAAALVYDDPTDPVWQKIRAKKSPAAILTDICGLTKDDPLYEEILAHI